MKERELRAHEGEVAQGDEDAPLSDLLERWGGYAVLAILVILIVGVAIKWLFW